MYQQAPVHLQDCILFGMQWKNQFYVDTRLPFGLRSAPLLFSAAIEWAAKESRFEHVFHYMDDFVVLARPAALSVKGACGASSKCAKT